MLYAFGFERVGELGAVPRDQTPERETGIRAGWL
jgi:hypothetical protein